ncbi:transcriptional regulator domain-containing protein [Paraburkholderia kururiensis]|uniref:transcriptional regulator domain-containing protein n=1 Tax=Paraburkholderia kururiensis TaxID=984307 RepID=UPI0005A8496D|nr:DUF6499 domain-containing protein [Paraburkholderia kururiensis]
MAHSLFPAPSHVFVIPEGIDWKRAADYPVGNDIEPQRLAWEFLRRNARYVSGYDALGHLHDATTDSWERREADRAREYFCLMWQIAKPVDPRTRWDELSPASRIHLIGPPPPKIILPVLQSIGDLDTETGTPTDVSALALQTQILVRLSVDGDAVKQGEQVTQIIRDLQKRIEVDVPTLNAKGKRVPVRRLASLHDYDATLRYVRVASGNFHSSEVSGIDEVAHVSYRRTPSRITGGLHFILRTLDAISSAHNVSRSDLDHVHAPQTIGSHKKTESKPADSTNQDVRKTADQYAAREHQATLEYPFGKTGQRWAKPLAHTIAGQFLKDLQQRDISEALDPKGEFIGEMTPEKVLGFMRRAQYYALEQGYLQIAASKNLPT